MPEISLTQKLSQLADEWKACLPLQPEDERRLWGKLRLDWNYHSNHIEGNTLTYGETELLFKYNQTHGGHDLRDYEEMKAHDVAITRVQEFAKGSQPLTQVEIRTWNEIILKEPFWKNAVTPGGAPTRKQIIPGQYKTQPNSVLMPSGDIFPFADPMDVPAKMAALTEKINRYASSIPGHVAQALAEIHHEFVVIHPFDDGNGRVARLIVNFLLLRHEYVPIVVLSEEKKRYLTALQAADGGFLNTLSDYIGERMIVALSMGIRAGNGESVEEPFDVEKEIALFARQQNVVLAPAPRKNAELLQELSETSLLPFFVSAIEKVGTLAKLFRETRLKVNHVSRENESWRNDFSKLSARDDSGELPHIFGLGIELVGYTKAAKTSFNISTTLTVFLEDFHYRITGENFEITHPYSEQITQNESDRAVENLLKSLFEQVRRRSQE